MFKEKCETESISIVIFSPMYTVCVIIFFVYNFNLLARLNCINILCRIRLSVIVPRGR